MSKFWDIWQNNSGGSFHFDEAAGITHFVVVEANDVYHATARAEEIGLYWNGCDAGRDCSCCGDRWSEPYGKGTDEPMVYGKPVAKATGFKWMKEGKETCVHYLDGRREWFGITNRVYA